MTYDEWKSTPPEPDYDDRDTEPEVYWLCSHCGHKTYKDEIARKATNGVGVVCLPCEEEFSPSALP